MARLRRPSSAAHNDSGVDASIAAASSAFANMTDLLKPANLLSSENSIDTFFQPSERKNQLSPTKNALICKKSSLVKTTKRQVLLKPMNFTAANGDLSVMTIRKDWDDELRSRPRKNLFSPVKLTLPESSSSGSSMQSMISDSDGSSDVSTPLSLTTAMTGLELNARIPLNLVSDAKTQLFSPAKARNVSILEFDTMIDALASTRLEDLMSESETEDTFCVDGTRDSHETGFSSLQPPTLLPPTWLSKAQAPTSRPSTPPASPVKHRLVSPSKAKQRIPTPPHNSSPNAFWSIEKVNQWNDQHSPKKIVRSPKKSRISPLDDSSSPSASPRKLQSPSKLTKAELTLKRDFEARKHALAQSFLLELDETITDGKIAQLAEATGGVQLIWSKTLNSTAGRANWKRTAVKAKAMDHSTTEYKHYASIELAEKVINDETSLFNVMAHEFCHLANFMVLGIKDRPHGAEFKTWGRKCTRIFGDRGVEVTTKHSFDIDYKYIWACTNDDCQAEFKRHSKSIDPSRHTCGVCRAQLLQVKPAPRKNAAAAPGVKTTNGYAGFVKEHYAATRSELPGATQKEIMTRIGEKYRSSKAKTDQACHQAQVPSDLDGLADKLEGIAIAE